MVAKELGKLGNYNGISRYQSTKNGPKERRKIKKTGGTGNQSQSCNHPDDSITENN